MSVVARDEVIEIAGAGPAGLAAAITLARAGRRVIVHEAQREVGYRFQGDLQGLENWTMERDVLDELCEMGLTTAFVRRACREGTAFDAWGQAYPVRSDAPLFLRRYLCHLLRRGCSLSGQHARRIDAMVYGLD
jgi:2-polyprenyl-6-methoxyphenol hydroxylase-like FAD-dependent oxidoreductase